MTELPDITEIHHYNYQPGDTLIVRLDRPPSMQEIDRIKETVRGVLGLPELPVLVCGPEASITVTNLADA